MRVRAVVRLVHIVAVRWLALVALGAIGAGTGVGRLAAQEPAGVQLASAGPRFLAKDDAAPKSGVPRWRDVSNAAVFRQRISLDLRNVPLGRALDDIARKAGLRLTYSAAVVSLEAPVTLSASDLTVGAALSAVLYDAGVDVLLTSSGQAALIKRVALDQPQVGAIVGHVTDAKTQTVLAGATVVVEGTRHSATTGSDGRYRITDVAPGTYTVRARYIGYAPGTAAVTVSADQEATADFTLEKSAQQLNEVVTTGTVVPTEVRALPSPITVITAAEIQEKNVTRVEQLLRGTIPGIVSWDGGTSDDLSRITVRGGSSLAGISSIKTYVDGIEVEDPSLLATIDPNSIERIELIRGPQASTLYGSEALDGVMQIFTKRGTAARHPVFQGQVAGGAIQTQWVSDNAVPTYRSNLSVSGGSDAFSYNVGGGRVYKGEWVSEYRDAENNLYGSLRGGQGWLTAELSGRLQWQNRGAPNLPLFQSFTNLPSLSAPLLTDVNYQSTGLGITLHAQATPHWQHTLTLGTDRILQEIAQRAPRFTSPSDTLLSLFSADYQKVTFQYSTTLQGALAQSLNGSLTAGVNLTSYKGVSVGDNSKQLNGTLNAAGVNYIARLVTTDRGYFAQGQLGLAEALFLTAGVRAEDNSNYGEAYGLAWAPRVGLSYVHALGEVTLKARASYGKSIRAPFPGERTGAVTGYGIQLANPNLGPESQRGVDAGLELYAGTWGTLGATYYHQTAGDLIDQVIFSQVGFVRTTQHQNVGQIQNEGLELEGSVSPRPWMTLSGNFAATKSRVQRVSPTYTGDLRVGDQVLGVPQHTGGANLRLAAGGWTANLGMVYTGSWIQTDFTALYGCAFSGTSCQASGRGYWINYPAFTKYRLAVSRRLSTVLTAFVNAENLMNSYAAELDNIGVTPGRTTVAGLNFRF